MFDRIKATEGPIRYEDSGRGHLKMVGHHNPYSMMQDEFEFVVGSIMVHKLTTGFEVATAFGISALAAAMGFRETGGKLASMDAYVEEQFNDAGAYRDDDTPRTFEDADGLKSAKFLAKHFMVQDHVEFHVGWSPTDTGKVIEAVHGNKKLDYAFIDAGHFTEWIRRDFDAIYPYFGDRGIIFFHDVYPDSFTADLVNYFETTTGGKLEVVKTYPEGENLGWIKIGL